MPHAAALGLGLFALWIVLSGHAEPLLVGLGAASCALVVWLCARTDRADRQPVVVALRLSRLPAYAVWLAREIALANLDVARRILSRRPDVAPTLVRLRASQRTELGRVIYANSITLTPGTVSIDLEDDEIVVHALSAAGARELAGGEMDARVRALERDA